MSNGVLIPTDKLKEMQERIEGLEKALHRAKEAMQAQNKSYDERLRLENAGLQLRLSAAEEALRYLSTYGDNSPEHVSIRVTALKALGRYPQGDKP